MCLRIILDGSRYWVSVGAENLATFIDNDVIPLLEHLTVARISLVDAHAVAWVFGILPSRPDALSVGCAFAPC